MVEANWDPPVESLNLHDQINDGALLRITVDGEALASEIVYCKSPGSRRKGVLRWRRLTPEQGALLAMPTERQGRAGWITSIHMVGVAFPLAVAWLDGRGRIIHSRLARPWRPYYASPRPASLVLELHHEHLRKLVPGALVSWGKCTETAP